MNYAGRAAAATLGFIAGDVPGAYIANDLYTKFTKNKTMSTPSTQRTKRKSSISLTGTPKKRRTSLSSMSARSSRSRRSSRSSSAMKEKPIAQSSLTVRHKKLTNQYKAKKKKYVKVPKQLKSQILQVFDSKLVSGYARINWLGNGTVISTNAYDSQKVFPMPVPRGTNAQQGKFFDPLFIQYVASRLWNNRPYVGGTLTQGAYSNLEKEKDTGWANFTPNLTTDSSAFKVKITELKAKITMKNNSGRTMYLKMFVCKPKYQRWNTSDTGNGLPIDDWEKCLTTDAASIVEGEQTATNKAGPINLGVSYFTYQASPLMNANWKRQWDSNIYEITLEPGQTHVHWLEGDVGDYDFSKMYTKGPSSTFVFNNIQKTDRHVFFIGVPELATGTALDARLQSENTQKLIFETTMFCTMKMPETAGTSITNIGNLLTNSAYTQPITQRRRAYLIDTFHQNPATTNEALNVNYDDNYTGKQIV